MAARVPSSSSSSGRREPQGSEPVPVQLTSLVPVRVVSVHGDFFDTELHQDAPLRILQSAVEDCFKVRPELQLLTHNRQPINPSVSLKRNGCLLLKGDPYVKIVLDIKKGTKLNLVCQMPHYEPIPLACEGADTVWEVKKKFCATIAKPELTPQRIRLLWRYWELNDKATLDYYHLHTNAKLSVMKKRGFTARPQQQQAQQPTCSPAGVSGGGVSGATSNEPPHRPNAITPAAAVKNKPAATGPVTCGSTMWPSSSKQLGHAVIPIDPGTDRSAMRPITADSRGQPQSFSVQDAELAKISQAAGLEELNRLKQDVASLERRIGACSTDRVGCELLEESYRATLRRVEELEATVGRFQHLLKRALTLM
ncbi:hypothetical protein DQ04_04931000 [Trypanosoma grayi]|uniref:hypothetical protein n=1 Tax=Trypanosoma grayi TaxID=71804 RepID=UPI0004F46C87|nr:hypothetical protein DQ04_04931000 [Trypanosoma grayi]KEG09619.1 hypothetical protein DQ04_04931000 [Trypanosoma grayi]